MGNHGVQEAIHYLDDFLVLGHPGYDDCSKALEICMQLCQKLGVAVAPHKTEGPSTKNSFLGILIYSEKMITPLR